MADAQTTKRTHCSYCGSPLVPYDIGDLCLICKTLKGVFPVHWRDKRYAQLNRQKKPQEDKRDPFRGMRGEEPESTEAQRERRTELNRNTLWRKR